MFSSLTVLSLEQAMTLPYLTLRLAEEGMRVIRVENPSFGDPNRYVGSEVIPAPDGGFETGMCSYYLPNNLGKMAITLNLAQERGQRVLWRLIRELPVDIFTTNQRPRSYAKLGIDYKTLRQLKPDLIWVGITGFGPDHDEAAYDPILQAKAGFMSLTGDPQSNPTVFGLPMVDLGAGEHAYGQIMKSLYRRETEGTGSRLDISMFQSAVSWLVSPVMMSRSFRETVTRTGNTHPFFAPVSVYPTQDGYVYFAVGNDRQWGALTQLAGFEGLAREAYARNAGRIKDKNVINQMIAEISAQTTTDWMIEAFNQAGIPISKVNSIEEVCEEDLVREKLVNATDPRTGTDISIAPPPVISEYLQENELTLDFPPRMGEHNAEIYGGVGLDVDELSKDGII
jgi:crotonobetainyl-CoA:carnitine CoA-transferase CaiB-like acyl-CoA transferase